MNVLSSWFDRGRWFFYTRLAVVGAASGLAAWLLVRSLAGFFGVDRPPGALLGSAVVRGVLVALALAFVVDRLWSRGR